LAALADAKDFLCGLLLAFLTGFTFLGCSFLTVLFSILPGEESSAENGKAASRLLRVVRGMMKFSVDFFPPLKKK